MQLSDLLPYIHEHVSDIPRSMALRRVREAARDFFTETKAWRADVVVPLVDGTALYTLTMPTDAELVEIHNVNYDDTARRPLAKKTETQQERAYRPHLNGYVDTYTQPTPGDIEFYGTPAADDDAVNVTVKASFRPVMTAAEIPDAMARHYEALVWGAMAMVYNMPDEKWSNITASQRYASLFAAKKNEARIETMNQNSSRVVRITQYGGV